MDELWQLGYSPWSLKARWALEHHRHPYRSVEYRPLVDELRLRTRLRRPVGRVSVPVLFADPGPVEGSFAIAAHVDRSGKGPRLLRDAEEEAVRRWDARTEAGMAAGRAGLLARLTADPEALAAHAPAWVPRALRASSGRVGAEYLARKYAARRTNVRPADELAAYLSEIRRTLTTTRAYLLGAFSFADIGAALALEFVSPSALLRTGLDAAARRPWHDHALAGAFPELLAWRDELLARHAPKALRRAS